MYVYFSIVVENLELEIKLLTTEKTTYVNHVW